MNSFSICVVLALVLAVVARDVSSPKWVNVTVTPNAHENNNPATSHVAEFDTVYTFCIPLTERPVGTKYTASITFTFDGVVDELVMDFMSNGLTGDFPYINKDQIKDGKIVINLHDLDGNNFNGWSDAAFNTHVAGVAYAKGAKIVSVQFSAEAMWEEATGLECKKHHNDDNQGSIPADGGAVDGNNNDDVIDIEITPIMYPGLSPATVRFIIFVSASFIGLMAIFCCCFSASASIEEYEDIAREEEMMSHVVNMQNIPSDEDAIMRRAQEESLQQYRQEQQMRAAHAAPQHHPDQQQYMRVPVMSPELYAQYLAAAQSQAH